VYGWCVVVVGSKSAVESDLAPSGSSCDAETSLVSPTLAVWVWLEASSPWLTGAVGGDESAMVHGGRYHWSAGWSWPAASVPGAPSAPTIGWGKMELTGRSPRAREKLAPERVPGIRRGDAALTTGRPCATQRLG